MGMNSEPGAESDSVAWRRSLVRKGLNPTTMISGRVLDPESPEGKAHLAEWDWDRMCLKSRLPLYPERVPPTAEDTPAASSNEELPPQPQG